MSDIWPFHSFLLFECQMIHFLWAINYVLTSLTALNSKMILFPGVKLNNLTINPLERITYSQMIFFIEIVWDQTSTLKWFEKVFQTDSKFCHALFMLVHQAKRVQTVRVPHFNMSRIRVQEDRTPKCDLLISFWR